jgi:hypothetical protein
MTQDTSGLRTCVVPSGPEAVSCSCVSATKDNSWWTVPLAAAATVVAPEPPTPMHEPSPFSLSNVARATGRLAKTDRLDAEVLARFGEAVRQRRGR